MQKVTNAELYRRIIDLTENLTQKIITRKLELFGHICRIENDRKIKSVVFGRLEGTNKRGRPHKEWMDTITEWCGASLQELHRYCLLEKQNWRRITRTASGTYGQWSLGY